ncbi:Phosphomevalonate kinase [Staphylococcus aureus]|uniref:Phosphomevalonate kinase n=1 Tax=Staphylococcus aureus TaxID=1280 RepID=A0A380DKV6_STAAU|nr:Phosphomevalonate kinase [Staphylococcus aureus]
MNGLSIKLKILRFEEVLIKNWPGLHIEPLQAPENMEVLIGWTGSPASSPHFVSEVKRLKSDPSFTVTS